MIENQVGKRYSEALSASIKDEGQLREALGNLRDLDDAFQANANLSRLFSHPSIPEKKKMALMGDLCEKISAQTSVRKIFQLLVTRKKMMYL